MRAWWRRRTLRFRLAFWYATGGGLLLALFSATLYLYVAQTLARPLGELLRADLAVIESRVELREGGQIWWDGKAVAVGDSWDAEDPWFEIWDEQGRLVRRCWPFTESRLTRVPAAPTRGSDTLSIFRIAPDVPLRVLSVPCKVRGAKDGWMIRVMRIHEPAAEALGALLGIIAIALPVVVFLLVAGGYAITRRWLKPLDLMVAEANRVSAEDFNRRLSVSNPHDELGQLAGVFNVTLDRLERSFTTLERFVADVSHELRTPLTTLRSVGEVGLRKGRTVLEYREIIGSMLEEAQRLQFLVQRLLELASAEGGKPALHRRREDMAAYVRNCVGELSILAEYRDQKITLRTEPCEVNTDPVIFRQVLQNLIDNAIKYSPCGSTITVAVNAGPNACVVSVADEGPGIPAQDRPQLMNRFFRPSSREKHGHGGMGLGLAITRAYMQVLGGELRYEPLEPKGSRFSLVLPRGPAKPGEGA